MEGSGEEQKMDEESRKEGDVFTFTHEKTWPI